MDAVLLKQEITLFYSRAEALRRRGKRKDYIKKSLRLCFSARYFLRFKGTALNKLKTRLP
jgi:hypothetical protein